MLSGSFINLVQFEPCHELTVIVPVQDTGKILFTMKEDVMLIIQMHLEAHNLGVVIMYTKIEDAPKSLTWSKVVLVLKVPDL